MTDLLSQLESARDRELLRRIADAIYDADLRCGYSEALRHAEAAFKALKSHQSREEAVTVSSQTGGNPLKWGTDSAGH